MILVTILSLAIEYRLKMKSQKANSFSIHSNTKEMGHEFLSYIPWKTIYVVVGLVILGKGGIDDYRFVTFILVGVLFFLLFNLITHIGLNYHYDIIIRIPLCPNLWISNLSVN